MIAHCPRSPSVYTGDDEPTLTERTIYVAGSSAPWVVGSPPARRRREASSSLESTPKRRRHTSPTGRSEVADTEDTGTWETALEETATTEAWETGTEEHDAVGRGDGEETDEAGEHTDAKGSDGDAEGSGKSWETDDDDVENRETDDAGEMDDDDAEETDEADAKADVDMSDAHSSGSNSSDADLSHGDSSHGDSSDADQTDSIDDLEELESASAETHDDDDQIDFEFEEYDEPDERVDENGLVVTDNALPDDGPFEDSHGTSDPEGPPSSIDIDQTNLARFETCFMDLFKFLVEWCVDLGGPDDFWQLGDEQPFCSSAFLFLLKWDPVILAKTLLAYIPDSVTSVLGRDNLSLDDLLSLSLATQCQDGGCYLDLATKSVVGPSKFPTATVDGELCEVGTYVGSTLDQSGGMSVRTKAHERNAQRRRNDIITPETLTKHFACTGRDDVKSRYLILAQVPLLDPAGKAVSLAIEALLQE